MSRRYVLRLSFEYYSGVCLWSGDAATEAAFGNAIDAEWLPLSATTQARVDAIIAWFDTSLNPIYPPDPGPWRQAEWDRLRAAVQDLYPTLAQELGPAFDLRLDLNTSYWHEDPDLDAYLADPQGFRRAGR
jgi:hypothetical protein